MIVLSNRYNWIRFTLLGISITIGGFIAHRFFIPKDTTLISTYSDSRDKNDVATLFKDDWFLLSARPYSPEYVNYILDTRSPNDNDLIYQGKLNIAVLRENGTFVGFVSYYKRSATEGQLLFLAVRKEFRGKRYGEKLLHYGVSELFSMGSEHVWLVTRQENLSAQKLYNRFGFVETERKDTFVYFSIWRHNLPKA